MNGKIYNNKKNKTCVFFNKWEKEIKLLKKISNNDTFAFLSKYCIIKIQ